MFSLRGLDVCSDSVTEMAVAETTLDACLHLTFPESYQTLFSKSMILNIFIFLISFGLIFGETGKALPRRMWPLLGSIPVTSHKANMAWSQLTPEIPSAGKQLETDMCLLLRSTKPFQLRRQTGVPSTACRVKPLSSVFMFYQKWLPLCTRIILAQRSCHTNHTSF